MGLSAEVAAYSQLLERVKKAFQQEYLTPSGRLVSTTQTAYVLSLQFDMLPEALRSAAAARLVENINSYGVHLTTGFLGTPYLCFVLTRFGYTDLAYQLLLQEKYPSWLYPVKMGATTIWERWDGIKPNGNFQTPGMNSFNHYAYGAIGDWMYRVMAGINTEESGAGYRQIRIHPQIGGGFTQVSASLDTYYGKLSSGWQVKEKVVQMDVEVPANTSATLWMPPGKKETIKEGGNLMDAGRFKLQADGSITIQLGSGIYHFEITQ
ncbi:MAG: hypothetical protein FYV88_2720 [Bacteroidetes bacterium]|nr:hypothetical protein [Bacteroidota bacterium]